MRTTPPTVFTIGHSTRPLAELLDLLVESQIECVVDVRRLPGSRAYPQYDADALRVSLRQAGIDYWHLTALGGLRRAAEAPAQLDDAFWTNPSFRRYSAYARTSAFAEGLRALEVRAMAQRCALMCAEAVWWRCHRRIIADHLLSHDHRVLHIMGPGKVMPATLTPGCVVVAGEPVYPKTLSTTGAATATASTATAAPRDRSASK